MMRPRDPDVVSLAKTSVSFSMVRHPFERIVSAYQDKVAFRYSCFNPTSYCGADPQLERIGKRVEECEDDLHNPVRRHLLQLFCQDADC